VIGVRILNRKKIHRLLLANSVSIDSMEVHSAIAQASIDDFKHSTLWHPSYATENESLVTLPGVKPMEVRVSGCDQPSADNPADYLLALAAANSDLFLLIANKFSCSNISPHFAVGHFIDRKACATSEATNNSRFWTLLRINGVPDFSCADLSNGNNLSSLLAIAGGRKAQEFRNWFHSNEQLNESEVLREYVATLREVRWAERLPVKLLRFVTTTALGSIPIVGPFVGAAADAFDTFVVDWLFRGKSPKFFIDELAQLRDSFGSK
jgi:hypothetical protein